MDRKSKGKEGEELAAQWLMNRGHEIVERNYQHGHLEVDIISICDNSLLVFTEVKWRSGVAFGHPEESVSADQQSRILKAADEYVHAINWQGDIRFDIISVEPRSGHIDHFEDAFY